MEDKIICYVSMFDANHKIIFPDGKIEFIPSTKLAELLPNYCTTYSTYKLHLVGDEKYINGIVEEIMTYEELNNSVNKLEIEVN